MRKINMHEWIAIAIALTLVIYLIIEGVFGSMLQPADDHSSVELNYNERNTMTNQNRTTLPGIVIDVIQEGSGSEVKRLDELTVHYTGKLTNGMTFDSSISRGTPFTFVIGQGQVIAGWEEGLLGMKVGEKRIITIAPEKAYGANSGHRLQNETLIFEVELLGIK